MPRRKRQRRISQPPGHHGFRAVHGEKFINRDLNPLTLNFEEFEAIKLMDYELHTQIDAAKYMDVSRPTLTRIYESARRKMAQALIEGRSIDIEGGNYEISDMWVICKNCSTQFSAKPDNTNKKCPWCGHNNI